MVHGQEESDFAIVAVKLTNEAERPAADGAKGGDQGECGPAKHAPDSEPGERVTGVWLAYGEFAAVNTRGGRCYAAGG